MDGGTFDKISLFLPQPNHTQTSEVYVPRAERKHLVEVLHLTHTATESILQKVKGEGLLA